MANPLNLTPGQKYKITEAFTDFDHIIHPVGETWIFVETNFLPYEDGLTLHVLKDSLNTVYRLKWTKEDQGDIIGNFENFITPC
jgi:hypothetical protein